MYELKQIVRWVEEAGQMALASSGKVTPALKTNRTLVTETDWFIENFLREKIHEICPDHHILGEELGRWRQPGDSEYCWVIDPIDGTVNFVKGLPFWGISVGLLRNDVPVLGVVYLPRLQAMFWAAERQGAYLNGNRCRVCELSSNHDEEIFVIPGHCHDFEYRFPFRLLCFGSAVASLGYVACGACIGTLLEGWNLWDIAAGLCIVKEAGAQVIALDSSPLTSFGGHTGIPFLAVSSPYQRDLLAGIRRLTGPAA